MVLMKYCVYLRKYKEHVVKSDFFRKIAGTILTRIFLIGMGLVTSVIVNRLLGPEGRGLYALALTVSAIGVQLANLGLHISNTYYVARNRTLLVVLVKISVGVSILLGSISGGFIWIFSLVYPFLTPLQGGLLGIALCYIPVGLLCMLLQNIILGIHEVRIYNFSEICIKSLSIFFIVMLFSFDKINVETVYFANIITVIIVVAIIMWWLQRYYFPQEQSTSYGEWSLSEYFSYGLKSYFACVFFFISTKVDFFLLSEFEGLDIVGYFSVATTLVEFPTLLLTTIGGMLFPKLASMSSMSERINFTEKTAKQTLGVLLLVGTIMAVLAQKVIIILYGIEFQSAAYFLYWMLIGLIPFAYYNAYAQLLAAVGNSNFYSFACALGVSIKLFISYMLLEEGFCFFIGIGNFILYGFLLFATKKILRRKLSGR